MCFDHFSLPNTSQIYSSSITHPTSCLKKKQINKDFFFCFPFLWSQAGLAGPVLLERTNPPIPDSYWRSTEVGLHVHLSSPCWIWSGLSMYRSCICWSCPSCFVFIDAATLVFSTHTVFFCSHRLHMAFILFLFFFQQRSLSPGKRNVGMHGTFKTKHSSFSLPCALTSCESLC